DGAAGNTDDPETEGESEEVDGDPEADEGAHGAEKRRADDDCDDREYRGDDEPVQEPAESAPERTRRTEAAPYDPGGYRARHREERADEEHEDEPQKHGEPE